MESKYPKDFAEAHDEGERKRGMPPGMGARALSDLTKHAMNRLDNLLADTLQLVDEPYDRFKLMAAIVATTINRFGNGPLLEVLPKELFDLSESKHRHAIIDCVNALSLQPEAMNPRERALSVVLMTCLRATYVDKKGEDAKFLALLDLLIRSK